MSISLVTAAWKAVRLLLLVPIKPAAVASSVPIWIEIVVATAGARVIVSAPRLEAVFVANVAGLAFAFAAARAGAISSKGIVYVTCNPADEASIFRRRAGKPTAAAVTLTSYHFVTPPVIPATWPANHSSGPTAPPSAFHVSTLAPS